MLSALLNTRDHPLLKWRLFKDLCMTTDKTDWPSGLSTLLPDTTTNKQKNIKNTTQEDKSSYK